MRATRWPPAWRPTKYGAQRLEIDGHVFDSKREAARYRELQLLVAAGRIRDLELHPGYPLQVLRLYTKPPPYLVETVGMFHADFRYVDLETGEVIVEDVKAEPTKTTAYRLRKRIVEAVHGIQVREVP